MLPLPLMTEATLANEFLVGPRTCLQTTGVAANLTDNPR